MCHITLKIWTSDIIRIRYEAFPLLAHLCLMSYTSEINDEEKYGSKSLIFRTLIIYSSASECQITQLSSNII